MKPAAEPDALPAPPAPRNRLRAWGVNLLKVGVSVGLLYYIFRKGNLRLDDVADVLRDPHAMVPVLLLGAIGISASGLRWQLLLQGEGITVPFLTVLRLTWIGHFWNMIFPGAVSGDAVKMFYIGRKVPEKREEAWSTVLADRVIGMIALVSFSAVAALSSFDFVWSRAELRPVLLTMLIVLLAAIVGGLVVAFGVGRDWRITRWFAARLPFAESIGRVYQVGHRLARMPRVLALAFFISFFAHGLGVANFILLGRAAGEHTLPATTYGVVAPIAMFTNAVPLTPGGVGMGEGVLDKLMTWAGGAASKGVSIMILYRVMFYALALVGLVLYILHRETTPASTPPAREPTPVASDPIESDPVASEIGPAA